MKSDFLASMSHELRTPLNAIIGFSDVLMEGAYGPLSAEQRDRVGDVLGARRQLLTLVNDILDLSKIEAGRVDLRLEPIDLANPLEEAFLLVLPAAQSKRIALESRVSPELLRVSADLERVRQIALNLLSNAIKFTGEGGRVTVDAVREDDFVRVSVSDTGIGIEAGDISRLFLAFSQLDGGYKRKFGGTGLGLSICKRLVELMGGEISVRSEPGAGSVFSFTLPVARDLGPALPRLRSPTVAPQALPPVVAPLIGPPGAEAQHAPARSPAPAEPPPPPSPSSAPPPSSSRPAVLVVEDADAEARVAEGVLVRAGYRVLVARSAEQALSLLGTEPISLVLLDIGLPGLSGLGLIDEIRRRAETRVMPIAVLTGRVLTPGEEEQLLCKVSFIAQKGALSRAEFVRRLSELSPARPAAVAVAPPEVLVIDDNETNRRVVRAMLKDAGVAVHEAPNAEEGLRLAHKLLPAIVLMDIEMPGMDGLEATRALGADPLTRGIPVVAVTAHAMVGDRERALAAGCVGYITNPKGRVALYEAIDRALGGESWRTRAPDSQRAPR